MEVCEVVPALLKWIGNKQRFAETIISYMPEVFNDYEKAQELNERLQEINQNLEEQMAEWAKAEEILADL